MQDMMKMYGMAGMDPSMFGTPMTHWCSMPTTSWYSTSAEHKDYEHVPMICEQLYDLAMHRTQDR